MSGNWRETEDFDSILKAGNLIYASGPNERKILVVLAWIASTFISKGMETEVLTNIGFQEMKQDKTFHEGTNPPGVYKVSDMFQIIQHTYRAFSAGKRTFVIIADANALFCPQNDLCVSEFLEFCRLAPMLRQSWILGTKMSSELHPRILSEFNDAGRALALIPWGLNACPWTKSDDQMQPGFFNSDLRSLPYTFQLGQIGDYIFNYRDFLERMAGRHTSAIPKAIESYLRDIAKYREYQEYRHHALETY